MILIFHLRLFSELVKTNFLLILFHLSRFLFFNPNQIFGIIILNVLFSCLVLFFSLFRFPPDCASMGIYFFRFSQSCYSFLILFIVINFFSFSHFACISLSLHIFLYTFHFHNCYNSFLPPFKSFLIIHYNHHSYSFYLTLQFLVCPSFLLTFLVFPLPLEILFSCYQFSFYLLQSSLSLIFFRNLLLLFFSLIFLFYPLWRSSPPPT